MAGLPALVYWGALVLQNPVEYFVLQYFCKLGSIPCLVPQRSISTLGIPLSLSGLRSPKD